MRKLLTARTSREERRSRRMADPFSANFGIIYRRRMSMATSSEPPSKKEENTYILDAESAAEMARLMRQDQLVTAGMGGIFPENIDLSGIQRVIDLACGPGGWPLEVAYTYS